MSDTQNEPRFVLVDDNGNLLMDLVDDPTRDLGKVDIASLDQYTPIDTDSGGGTVNALPVIIMTPASGGGQLGTSANPMQVSDTLSLTTTAWTPYFNNAVNATYATIKGSTGKLGGISVSNVNATDAWLQIFNSTAPTVGTTTPTFSFLIPKGDGSARGTYDIAFGADGCTFATGITIAGTTTSTGNTSPGTGLTVNAWYL